LLAHSGRHNDRAGDQKSLQLMPLKLFMRTASPIMKKV
jgi:hypothetical protein